jgi:hypothetical protein
MSRTRKKVGFALRSESWKIWCSASSRKLSTSAGAA